jgi:hypothetical protein
VKFTLTINMDNAAFEPYNGNQLALILERFSKRLEGYDFTPGEGLPLMDINGNKVGTWEVTE